MSGIFGIFNRSGKAIEEKTVNTMLEEMSYWEPDEKGVWIHDTVALGHAMLWNTPESRYEHLPLEQKIYILTMDARIDNRDELVKKIELAERDLSEIGDSEFILGAYKKWGEECPKYLLGDFAFAIWDENKQQLFCARDHIGVKQFYYHIDEDIFLFGNDLKCLTKYPAISKDINDEAVAIYFVNDQLNSRTLTFFKDIIKLPPAHTIAISKHKTKLNCYWTLGDNKTKTELPSIEDYVKKLRELLDQSVYDRMRSSYDITSHLSGGLDSSAIAVIAARKLKQKGERLLSFNWLHQPGENDDPKHFEWANSVKIAQLEDIKHNYVQLTSKDIYQFMKKRDIVYGETVGFWYEYSVRKSVQMTGSRTILSGWGGDDFVTYRGAAYYSDLMYQGKILCALQQLRYLAKDKKIKKIKSMLGLIYTKLFMPFVPSKLYCYFPRSNCEKINSNFPTLKKDFLIIVKDIFKKMSYLSRQNGKTMQKDMIKFWLKGGMQTRIESWAAEGIYNRIEYAYPLLDKRIIEFMLEVPPRYLVHNREGRYLFRLAVKDLLPNNILWMGKEAEINRVNRYLSLLIQVYKKILSSKDFDSVESKYIDSNAVLNLLEEIDEDTLHLNFIEIDASVSLLFSQLDDA